MHRISDRPLPCGSGAGEPAAVADEPFRGWEVGPPDSFHQAASNERDGVRVPLCEPTGAEVMSGLLLYRAPRMDTRLDFLGKLCCGHVGISYLCTSYTKSFQHYHLVSIQYDVRVEVPVRHG
jgi:hypothetical protein